MITEDYVSFEIAKMLKEKGFDSPCMGRYSVRSKEFHLDCTKMCNNGGLFECAAPSQAMAMKWLREEHNLCIEIFVTWRDKIPHYQWRINNLITQDTIVDTPCLEKPEQAVEAALKYAFENLI